MKKRKMIIGLAIIVIASAFTVVNAINWKVKDDAYKISFRGGKIKGTIKGLVATIEFDEQNLEKSKINATLDVNTLDLGMPMLTQHAKDENGLNAEKFQTITFQSTSISGTKGVYNAKGNVTMKGVTKEVNLPFTFEQINQESQFKGTLTLIPKDFNVTRGGTPDEVQIEINLPVTKL